MLKTLERFEVGPPLLHWEGILRQWTFMNKEIFNSSNSKIAPYSFRERPNISVMAGAAIKAGWVALEECWSEKKSQSKESGIYGGRADLILWRGDIRENIEAKFTCDSFLALEKKCKDRHNDAKTDASKLKPPVKGNNIALTFIVPRLVKSELNSFESNALVLMRHCLDLKPDIFGAIFPGWVERQTSDRNDKEKGSVGIIVIGNVVK